MKIVVRFGICEWVSQYNSNSVSYGQNMSYNLREPRQGGKQCGRCLSLVINGVKHQHKSPVRRPLDVFEHSAELNRQRG